MNYTKTIMSVIGGGIALFLAGWLIWGFLLMNIQAPYRTTVEGIAKPEPDILLIFISCIAAAGLLTLVFQRWAGIKTLITGAKAGAMIMVLYGIAADLAVVAEFNILEMPYIYINVIGYLIWGALGGAIIGWILGRGEA